MSVVAWILLDLISGFIGSKIVNQRGEGIVFDVVVGIVAQATDDKWHDVKKEADKAWHELEHSVEGAFAAIKPHSKTPNSTKKN